MVTVLLQTLGGLGLFLLGMELLTDGLKTLAGRSLRELLRRTTRSPTTGAVSGALLTAVVQSSSATTVATVGFVAAGLLSFSQALGVIIGANIGTTATGWLVALFGFKVSLEAIAMPLVLAGVLLQLFARKRWGATGRALAGFALIFIGLGVLQEAMAAAKGTLTPEVFPGDDLLGRLQLIALGMAMTAVTQSSSAGVAAAMAALNAGAIGFPQAAAMVIGMNVGTTVTAALATIGGSSAVKRTAYAHVGFNVLTGAVAYALLGVVEPIAASTAASEPELALAGFHTLFNGLGALMVLPFADRFAHLMERLVPAHEPVLSRHLEPRLLREPALAVDAVTATLYELTAWVLAVLRPILGGVRQGALEEALRPMATALSETHGYLDSLGKGHVDGHVSRRAVRLMYAVDHLDRILVRMGREDRIETLLQRSDLRAAAVDLDTVLGRLEQWVRNPVDPGVVDESERAWRALAERKDHYREEVLDAAALGTLSTGEAAARLDAMRWLVRMAHHIWRLVYHLDLAHRGEAADPGAPAEAGVEHEAD